MSEHKFKVGDRVKVWGFSDLGTNYNGEEFTIKDVSEKKTYIRIKENLNRVHPRQCELIEPAKPKVGDEVDLYVNVQPELGDNPRGLNPHLPLRTKLKIKAEIVEVGG